MPGWLGLTWETSSNEEIEELLAMCAIKAYIFFMAVKEPKTQRFVARVSAADKDLFQKAAAIEGRSMAKFIITHVREVARDIVQQNSQIQLSSLESRRFVEALLAPPRKPNNALKEAIARYRKQVISA